MQCPCGNSAEYDACCERFLSGTAAPNTAEELMRSRYSAYAQNNVDYLISTAAPSAVDDVDMDATRDLAHDAKWLGLEILSKQDGGPQDEEGVVEFVASYELDGEHVAHHESSFFRRIEGLWRYVDGEMIKAKPIVRQGPKIGRNAPCPCGSGKKFKKCCG